MRKLKASDYGLFPHLVSPAALEVIEMLGKAGFDAYIVGGGVRDALLGLRPKDFDAVTNATPADIKRVFGKRCRIIGRRFELAHVYMGRDLIEVATFRAPPHRNALTTEHGMIMRDNVWGTIEQDYKRRDFTINALYYHPQSNRILDFCHAMEDIQQKTLRFLGDPATRIQEDPVRILRILRFASKLDFNIDPPIVAALTQERVQLLAPVSAHRLYDELHKMFSSGHIRSLMQLLIQYHVWPTLFRHVPPVISAFIERAAVNTDIRIHEGKSINPAFFFAVLLWEPFVQEVQRFVESGMNPAIAWTQAGIKILSAQEKQTAIPRFAQNFIREIWELQPRLTNPKPRQVPQLVLHPRFRAGFDFLWLREVSGDTTTQTMGTWWEHYQTLSRDDQEKAINQLLKRQQKAIRAEKQRHAEDTPSPSLQDIATHVAASPPLRDKHGDMILLAENIRPNPRAKKGQRITPHDSITASTDNTFAHIMGKVSEQDVTETFPTAKAAFKPRTPLLTKRKRRPRDLTGIPLEVTTVPKGTKLIEN